MFSELMGLKFTRLWLRLSVWNRRTESVATHSFVMHLHIGRWTQMHCTDYFKRDVEEFSNTKQNTYSLLSSLYSVCTHYYECTSQNKSHIEYKNLWETYEVDLRFLQERNAAEIFSETYVDKNRKIIIFNHYCDIFHVLFGKRKSFVPLNTVDKSELGFN
jgi:hypothetical protein